MESLSWIFSQTVSTWHQDVLRSFPLPKPPFCCGHSSYHSRKNCSSIALTEKPRTAPWLAWLGSPACPVPITMAWGKVSSYYLGLGHVPTLVSGWTMKELGSFCLSKPRAEGPLPGRESSVTRRVWKEQQLNKNNICSTWTYKAHCIWPLPSSIALLVLISHKYISYYSFLNLMCLLDELMNTCISRGENESEVAQSCQTLCDLVDCSAPGSSVHGILQARILEWVAISFSRGIFPTQGLNPGLLHCRQMLQPLSYQGSIELPVEVPPG